MTTMEKTADALAGVAVVDKEAKTTEANNSAVAPGNARRVVVDADNIPGSLKAHDCWVTWRYETKAGKTKPDKVPYQALHPGRLASSTDRDTWAPFNDAFGA